MFANLTLVCAILFGEFEVCCVVSIDILLNLNCFRFTNLISHHDLFTLQIRDFTFDARDQTEQNNTNSGRVVDQTSFAFSIMCIFFTIMYASFSVLVFSFSNSLLEESVADARDAALSPRKTEEQNHAPGFLGGDRFGVSRSYGKNVNNIEVL
jgi:hypothetical protein